MTAPTCPVCPVRSCCGHAELAPRFHPIKSNQSGRVSLNHRAKLWVSTMLRHLQCTVMYPALMVPPALMMYPALMVHPLALAALFVLWPWKLTGQPPLQLSCTAPRGARAAGGCLQHVCCSLSLMSIGIKGCPIVHGTAGSMVYQSRVHGMPKQGP